MSRKRNRAAITTHPQISRIHEDFKTKDCPEIWKDIVDSLTYDGLCLLLKLNQKRYGHLIYGLSDLCTDLQPIMDKRDKYNIQRLFPSIVDRCVDLHHVYDQQKHDNYFYLIRYMTFCIDYGIPIRLYIQDKNTVNAPINEMYVNIDKVCKRYCEFQMDHIRPKPIKFVFSRILDGLRYMYHPSIRLSLPKCDFYIKAEIFSPTIFIGIRDALSLYLIPDLIAIIIRYLC
jgi:hypothetical protein